MVYVCTESNDENSGYNLNNKQCHSKVNTEKLEGTTDKLRTKTESLELQNIRNNSANANIHLPYPDLELRFQPSTSRIETQNVVRIRSACKHYGTITDHVVVLDKLNMTVPKGIIYGLLGASGCGKTTLLNCIVGRKKLDSGEIWVLDEAPGSKGGSIPGPRIGYMPQETALYGKFSIRENLEFFGWISGMTTQKIRARSEYLIKLLMLPNAADQKVESLSNGQQRRVSLAIALLHEPELLILDEPTVGLDPVLRETIWNHFFDITREGRITVIITTHYIDETRNAHCVALMRGGYFLAEDSPESLLYQFGLETLDGVFFKLSNNQCSEVHRSFMFSEEVTKRKKSSNLHTDDNVKTSLSKQLFKKRVRIERINKSSEFGNKYHMKALLWKNCLWMIRNIHMMLFALVLPFIESAIMCVVIGSVPTDLSIAVVNYETHNIMKCENNITCNNLQLSCYYLKHLEKHGVNLIPYEFEDAARQSVLNGTTYASVTVKTNYSASLSSRVQDWQYSSPADILSSEIDVFRDVSSKIVANYLQAILYECFGNFLHDYMASCNIESRWLTNSIKWENPVYGQKHPSYRDFAIPGLVQSFAWAFSASAMVFTLLIENNDGFLERLLVIGISKSELIISHMICQFVIMCLQTAASLVCLFAVFNITIKGSLLLVVLLTLLTGFFGMCFGLCVSCVCKTEKMAFYAIMGSFLPGIMVSGIIWPVEGLHYILKPLGSASPLTHAAESMRSIMYRGSEFSTEIVYVGFTCITIWTMICLIITIIVLKYKKD